MRLNQSLKNRFRTNIAVLSLGLVLEAPSGLVANIPSVSVSNSMSAGGNDLVIEQQLPLVVENKPIASKPGVMVGQAKTEQAAETMSSVVKSVVVDDELEMASRAAEKKTEKQVQATPTPIPSPTPEPRDELEPTPILSPEPTATPKPAPVVKAPDDLEASFATHAATYGVDVDLLRRIANCESHFHSGSVNGIYGGMFQFSPSTWASTRRAMEMDENPDLRFDGEEAIRTAAFKIGHGGQSAWAACLR